MFKKEVERLKAQITQQETANGTNKNDYYENGQNEQTNFADPEILYSEPVSENFQERRQEYHQKEERARFMEPTITNEIRSNRENEKIRERSREFIRQAQAQFEEKCTFKPKITSQGNNQSDKESRDERWRKLTQPRKEMLRQREIEKAKREIEEIRATCPFRPQLGGSATNNGVANHKKRDSSAGLRTSHNPAGNRETFQRSVMSHSSSCTMFSRATDISIADRLNQEGERKKQKLERLKREQEQAVMQECSFQPNTNHQRKYSSSHGNNLKHHSVSSVHTPIVNKNKFLAQPPIYKRVDQELKAKQERMERLREDTESQQTDNLFRPNINERSEKIAQIKQIQNCQAQEVSDRLYSDASTRIERNQRSKMSIRDMTNQSMNSSMVDPYQFHPEISDVSKVIAEKSEMYQGGLKDFQTRQSEFLERQREKREKLRNQYSEDAAHSFQPRINLTSEVICASDPEREAETPKARFARMSQQAFLKQKV